MSGLWVMASSKKPPASKTLPHQLKSVLVDVFKQKYLINPKLDVALSGGLDSVVLLYLLLECQKTLPFQLHAHHVNHGLSVNAGKWENFCQDTCKKQNIPLTISKVTININSGLGIEATAREARYQALQSSNTDFICLAHHQDDQAETLLLQLARGAGIKGLAGMGVETNRLLRPLLGIPRSTLEAYAKQHKLVWIEDESNSETKFDRNFMRHEILPRLEKQYPAIKQTISRTAQHMAEADCLLDDLAAIDVKNCQLNQQDDEQLLLAPLAQLSNARVKNVLRWWLALHGADIPSTAQLQQITQQLLHAGEDALVKIKLSASLILRRFQGSAYLVKNVNEGDNNYNRGAFSLVWQGEQVIILPDQSRLLFSQKLGEGIAMRHIEAALLSIRYRRGGETIKPEVNRPTRRLNALLQTSNMPPWQRERLPLVFLGDNLVLVPNIAVDANFKAMPDEMGLVVQYL